jgi:hypothetical protein
MAAAPEYMENSDALSQSEVTRSLQQLSLGERERSYSSQKPIQQDLKHLRADFERDRVFMSLSKLKKRVNLSIPADYRRDCDDPNLQWNCDSSYLDFFNCVSAGIGLDAFVPNAPTVHNYEFSFSVSYPTRSYRSKYAKLGFDPIGAMLWIGRTPAAEDAWIAMAPTESLEVNCPLVPPGSSSGATKMTPKHSRILTAFLSWALQKSGYPGAMNRQAYPAVGSLQDLKANTDIL